MLVGAAIVAPCLTVSLTALGIPGVWAHAATAVAILVVALLANKWVPRDLAAIDKSSRFLFALWILLAAGAIFRVSSLALFIDDVSRTEHAFQRQARELDEPGLNKPFYLKHNCSTCYLVAARLAGDGAENLYDKKHYRSAEVKTPVHDEIGDAFHIDQYQYPPPFLLGPYLGLAAGLDFFQIRALWFALSVLLFVLVSASLTVWISGWKFSPLWLVWPAMLNTSSVIATLQIGNAHAFMVLISVLAMLLFKKNWNLLGGGLLAYAVLSKLFPGILVGYLLMRRKWKACAWTCACMVALCLLTLFAFGATPFRAFLSHQLPGLISGDSFSFAFVKPGAMLDNLSIMGIPFKLEAMGITLPWDARGLAQVLTWIYTVLLLGLIVIATRRHAALGAGQSSATLSAENRLLLARVWTALLVLAQLRSPFLPGTYGNTAIILLLALLLPVRQARPLRLVLIGLGVLAYAVVLPLPVGPQSTVFDFGFGLVSTLLAAGLAALVVLRRP